MRTYSGFHHQYRALYSIHRARKNTFKLWFSSAASSKEDRKKGEKGAKTRSWEWKQTNRQEAEPCLQGWGNSRRCEIHGEERWERSKPQKSESSWRDTHQQNRKNRSRIEMERRESPNNQGWEDKHTHRIPRNFLPNLRIAKGFFHACDTWTIMLALWNALLSGG